MLKNVLLKRAQQFLCQFELKMNLLARQRLEKCLFVGAVIRRTPKNASTLQPSAARPLPADSHMG
jgi:hypothetical protein